MLIRRKKLKLETMSRGSSRHKPIPFTASQLHAMFWDVAIEGLEGLWWKQPGRKRQMNKRVGTPSSNGYLQVMIGGEYWQVSRLLWVMRGKGDPYGFDIDHRNFNVADNSEFNTRKLTHAENLNNNRHKGYFWDKAKRRWCARLIVRGQIVHCSQHKTEGEAIAARAEAVRKHLPHLM